MTHDDVDHPEEDAAYAGGSGGGCGAAIGIVALIAGVIFLGTKCNSDGLSKDKCVQCGRNYTYYASERGQPTRHPSHAEAYDEHFRAYSHRR
ncbi:MAG: hypothetical protein WCI72_03180 [archaeon]